MNHIRTVHDTLIKIPGLSDRVSAVPPQRVDERLPAVTRRATLASAKTTAEKKMRFPVFFMWSLLPKVRLLRRGTHQHGYLTMTSAAGTSQSRRELAAFTAAIRLCS